MVKKLQLKHIEPATKIRWTLLLLILIFGFVTLSSGSLALLVYLIPLVFVFMHGSRRYGLRNILVVFGIIFAVSYIMEYLGVHTGLIFGDYVYSVVSNGPILGGVPPLIMLSYFSIGYAAWHLAKILIGNDTPSKLVSILGTSALAAMLMVMWDLAGDPTESTVLGKWIWINGGAYFGVPYQNFIGWFVTTFLFFILVGLFLLGQYKKFQSKETKAFTFEPVALYAITGIPIVVTGLIGHPTVLQKALSLVALFGMGIPVLAASLRVWLKDKSS